jgi:ferritin-like metal-binding protein YciE
MSDKTLKDLFVHALKDIYFAENAIYKALPKLIDAAMSDELKEALTKHRGETETHISRLEDAFQILGMKPQTTPCEAIRGILQEGDELLEKFGGSEAGDAAIVFAGQAVEHYEINRYGSLRTWATDLGWNDVAALLADTLEEEHAADEKLTELAEGGLNLAAETKASDRVAEDKSSSKRAAQSRK